MELGLRDSVAIVTGASRGIGRAIAQVLAGEGMRLSLVARSSADLTELADDLPTDVLTHAVDLRDPAVAARVVEATAQHFGQLDLLVNNAGATVRGDFLGLSEQQWEDGYALKLFGAVRCTRAAWPHLVLSGGSVVNIIGIGGRTGSSEFTIGGSVNAALMNLTKSLADRGVSDGIRVNAINPGSIKTDRLTSRITTHAAARGITQEQAQTELAAAARVARFGEPAEIARVVAFLASTASSYVQGAVIDVDGGATRTL